MKNEHQETAADGQRIHSNDSFHAPSEGSLRSSPLANSYWREVASELVETARTLGVALSHFAAISERIVDMLLFLEEKHIPIRQLSGLTWYRSVYMGSALSSRAEWTASNPHFHLDNGRNSLVPTDGLYEIDYQGQRLILVTPSQQSFWGGGIEDLNPLVLGGADEACVLSLVQEFFKWATTKKKHTTYWGGDVVGQEAPTVHEHEVVLPKDSKVELLQYLDRFWNHREAAQTLGLPLRRGLLLAGHAGTGKTQFIRHLFTRFPVARRHILTPTTQQSAAKLFSALLSQIRDDEGPSIVVIEDIESLFSAQGLTPQFFLNALDGHVVIGSTVLWVATTNDPSALNLNLLDRPGRFDRIVVFREPGPTERAEMIDLFSDRSLPQPARDSAVAASNGLMGAHIREACVSARLAEMESTENFGGLLLRELSRLCKQHEAARRYDLELDSRRAQSGFGRRE